MLTRETKNSPVGIIRTMNISYGNLAIVGGFTTVDSQTRNRIRVTSNTTAVENSTFTTNQGTAFNNVVTVATKNLNGSLLYIGGAFTIYNSQASNRFIVLNSNGTIARAFPSGANGTIEGIYVHSDGKIVITGQFTTFDGISLNRIVRLNADYTIDATFNIGTGFNSDAKDICFDGAHYYITGSFSTYNGQSCKGLAKIAYNGTLAISQVGFNGDFSYYCKLDGLGNIYIGGQTMTTYNGASIANNFVKLATSNLALNSTFNTNLGSGFNNRVANFSVHNGFIYVGGNFTTIGASSKAYFAKLTTDGTLVTGFPTHTPSSNVRFATLINNNQFVAIGGSFVDFANSVNRDRFAVTDLNGANAGNWNSQYYDGSFDPTNVSEFA